MDSHLTHKQTNDICLQSVWPIRRACTFELRKEYWIPVKDGDDRARGLYLRHYSARHYRDGRPRRKFVGPGEYIVLLTLKCDALFVWRKFISDDNQEGVNCAIFRNEGQLLSSDLIKGACEWAKERWPGERVYTYVNDAKIKSVNPGYCFKKTGWSICGRNKSGKLTILESQLDAV